MKIVTKHSDIERLSKKENDNKIQKCFFFSKTYRNFQVQEYLTFNLPNYITNSLTKLRISAHQLLIEKGDTSDQKLKEKSDYVLHALK